MKLATLADGSRDGQLVVVARDLATAHFASAIASRLQQVLDDWNFISPQLHDLASALDAGKARHAFAFDPRQCLAPLPRAYAWVAADGHRGAGDALLGACDSVRCDAAELVCATGVAVVTGDMAPGGAAGLALDGVRLLLLAADWQLPDGAGVATAFAPVAVTPDEAAWRGGLLHPPPASRRNGDVVATADAVPAGQALAQATRWRGLRAGAIVGCGAGPGLALRRGDTLHVDAAGSDGQSVFGAIVQRLEGAG